MGIGLTKGGSGPLLPIMIKEGNYRGAKQYLLVSIRPEKARIKLLTRAKGSLGQFRHRLYRPHPYTIVYSGILQKHIWRELEVSKSIFRLRNNNNSLGSGLHFRKHLHVHSCLSLLGSSWWRKMSKLSTVLSDSSCFWDCDGCGSPCPPHSGVTWVENAAGNKTLNHWNIPPRYLVSLLSVL